MGILKKIKRAVRGEVKPKAILLEAIRLSRANRQATYERASLDQIENALPLLQITKEPDPLLSHFRSRTRPRFFPGFSDSSIAPRQVETFPFETESLLSSATQIVDQHAWPVMGFGVREFGDQINWRRDLLTGYVWPLDYHRDLELIRKDGSDVRVLWEVNRLGHLVQLARAYVVAGDERFIKECIRQLQSWAEQNPYGRGINWTCAMEVALRAINLVALFEVIRCSPELNFETLTLFLKLFHHHGTYITNNLEFSNIATSNHYLSDVTGLLFLGVMLPEFGEAASWREFGLSELKREMDKQVLPDGADFEASTGYHRYVVELLLYSFLLCQENEIEIETTYWDKLGKMLEYMNGYLRPDRLAPLMGDSDGGQVLPVCMRRADEHTYLLALGAATFKNANWRAVDDYPVPELLWLSGTEGLTDYLDLPVNGTGESKAFPNAGTYVLRKDNNYLCLNASGAGLNGRGSHGHNDALSIEVMAKGRPFIVDAGTYLYTADLRQRHLFRSTAYHSTIQVDGEEQNTIVETAPFVIGDEAQPRVLQWQSSDDSDKVVAEHYGYQRFASPVTHRRTIVFDKTAVEWLVEDDLIGQSNHEFAVRFHFAPGLELRVGESSVTAYDDDGVGLRITLLESTESPVVEIQATSRDYGEKTESQTACWHFSGKPGKLRWRIGLLP